MKTIDEKDRRTLQRGDTIPMEYSKETVRRKMAALFFVLLIGAMISWVVYVSSIM